MKKKNHGILDACKRSAITDWHTAVPTVEITKDFYARSTDKQEKCNLPSENIRNQFRYKALKNCSICESFHHKNRITRIFFSDFLEILCGFFFFFLFFLSLSNNDEYGKQIVKFNTEQFLFSSYVVCSFVFLFFFFRHSVFILRSSITFLIYLCSMYLCAWNDNICYQLAFFFLSLLCSLCSLLFFSFNLNKSYRCGSYSDT